MLIRDRVKVVIIRINKADINIIKLLGKVLYLCEYAVNFLVIIKNKSYT